MDETCVICGGEGAYLTCELEDGLQCDACLEDEAFGVAEAEDWATNQDWDGDW